MALAGHADEIARELSAHYQATMDVMGRRILEAGVKARPEALETKDAEQEFIDRVLRWVDEFAPSAAVGISTTTKSQIQDAISAGTAAGDGVEEIAERIVRETGGYTAGTIPFRRAQVIARTETHSAAQAALDEALTSIGLDDIDREWITVADERSRPTHMGANGQRRKKGDFFDVGAAKLEYPGDPRGPGEEIINCRCVLVGVIDDDE